MWKGTDVFMNGNNNEVIITKEIVTIGWDVITEECGKVILHKKF